MVSTLTWLRYLKSKAQYTADVGPKNYKKGLLKPNELPDFILEHLYERLTFLHWNKGEEMAPTISGKGATLLVRILPTLDPTHVYVGDVVLLKNPIKSNDFLIRRLAATEGYEMASTDEKDESFVLKKNQCWVVAENQNLKVEEAIDSRTFGPVPTRNIIGRVLYCLRSAIDHGRVENSTFSMKQDSPVLEVELDVDEMAKNLKD